MTHWTSRAKAPRNQYQLRVPVPSVPQPAPDSDKPGPALDARTSQHFLPDWDGPTVPRLVHQIIASRNKYQPRTHVPIDTQPAVPYSDEHGHALATRTGQHPLPDWDGPTVPSLCLRRTGPPGQRPHGTSTSSEFISLAPLNRQLTRTNMVPPPMLGPARTPSLTRTDLQCSATACGPHGHLNNGLKEQVPAPSSCPH